MKSLVNMASISKRLGRTLAGVVALMGALLTSGCAVEVADGDVELDETTVEWAGQAAEAPSFDQVPDDGTSTARYDVPQQKVALHERGDVQGASLGLMADGSNEGGDDGEDTEDNPDPTPWVLNPDPTPWHPNGDNNQTADPDPQPWRD